MLMSVRPNHIEDAWNGFRRWYIELAEHPPLYNGHQYTNKMGECSAIVVSSDFINSVLAGFRVGDEGRNWHYVVDVCDEDAMYLMLRFGAVKWETHS